MEGGFLVVGYLSVLVSLEICPLLENFLPTPLSKAGLTYADILRTRGEVGSIFCVFLRTYFMDGS